MQRTGHCMGIKERKNNISEVQNWFKNKRWLFSHPNLNGQIPSEDIVTAKSPKSPELDHLPSRNPALLEILSEKNRDKA